VTSDATSAVAGVTATADTAIRAPATPAGPDPGRPPSTGESIAAPDGRWSASGRLRPLPGLRIGRHVATDSALERIRPSATESGLLLGWDEEKQPVMIRLFRSEATRMTLVGGLWISRVLVFRALGVGARVAIVTSRPEIWQEFGRWATGGDQRVAVLPPDHRLAVTASSLLPVLFLYDGELLAPAQRPDLGPWQTQLTVLRQLTPYGFPAMQEANLVAVQRLAAEEAAAASSALRMSRRASSWLTLMRYDMLALLAGGGDEYLWVTPTPIELERFGPVTR
jgi:hypothetical protein